MAVIHEHLDVPGTHYLVANIKGTFVTFQLTHSGEEYLRKKRLGDGDKLGPSKIALLKKHNFLFTNSTGTEQQFPPKRQPLPDIGSHNPSAKIGRTAGIVRNVFSKTSHSSEKASAVHRSSEEKPGLVTCKECGCKLLAINEKSHRIRCPGRLKAKMPSTSVKNAKLILIRCKNCRKLFRDAAFADHARKCQEAP